MNLIEAIRSGRPFRRPARDGWIEVNNNNLRWVGGSSIAITIQDVVAETWEIQEPTVTITASQFWEAIEATWGKCDDDRQSGFHRLARRLGLETL